MLKYQKRELFNCIVVACKIPLPPPLLTRGLEMGEWAGKIFGQAKRISRYILLTDPADAGS